MFKVNDKNHDDVDEVVLVFLLLTFNTFYTFFWCFYCWIWEIQFWMGTRSFCHFVLLFVWSVQQKCRNIVFIIMTIIWVGCRFERSGCDCWFSLGSNTIWLPFCHQWFHVINVLYESWSYDTIVSINISLNSTYELSQQ